MMKTPPMTSPLAGDVTIDSSDDDNGYLMNARATNKRALAHHDAKLVAANLANKNSFNAIISHGAAGIVYAGSGMRMRTSDRVINLFNVRRLGFNELGATAELVIYSCHTAAGEQGANLLFEIAKLVKAPVWGTNGFIFLDEKGQFKLQHHAEWLVATPDKRPDVRPPARPPQGLTAIPHGGVKRFWGGRPWDRVTRVTYDDTRRRHGAFAQPAYAGRRSISFSKDEALDLVKRLGLARPYHIKGAPGAPCTGDLVFEFTNGEQNAFRVLSNRLIQDVQTGLSYFTSGTVSRGFHPSSEDDD